MKEMKMSTSKNWYAIYTRPRWEKKIANLLAKENVITYCPLNRVLRQWSDRKKLVYEPLFSCYVFVQVSNIEMAKVKETAGVVGFVCCSNRPSVIKDAEIEIIKEFLSEYTNVQSEKVDVRENDLVRIVNGALSQYEGYILAVNKNKVIVSLPSLGYKLVAEVQKSCIELVKKPDVPKYA